MDSCLGLVSSLKQVKSCSFELDSMQSYGQHNTQILAARAREDQHDSRKQSFDGESELVMSTAALEAIARN